MALSSDALFALAGARANEVTAARIEQFQAFFPARDGFDTQALATAAIDPSQLSSSKDKSMEQAALDARARMNANYATMAASGQPLAWNSVENQDRNTLFGDLDRRSLLAVRENVGNLFSAEEQEAARALMTQQQNLGMGVYAGPASQRSKFYDPYSGNALSRLKANVEWLGKVSSDEKQTDEWMQQRLAVSTAMRDALYSAEGGSGSGSLVDVLDQADRARAAANDPWFGLFDGYTLSDIGR